MCTCKALCFCCIRVTMLDFCCRPLEVANSDFLFSVFFRLIMSLVNRLTCPLLIHQANCLAICLTVFKPGIFTLSLLSLHWTPVSNLCLEHCNFDSLIAFLFFDPGLLFILSFGLPLGFNVGCVFAFLEFWTEFLCLLPFWTKLRFLDLLSFWNFILSEE